MVPIYAGFIIILTVLRVYAESEHPLLLLMSLDGFRYDFISPNITPHIWSLGQEGVYISNGVKVQVTTVTSSNHVTMVTGLHQESHGIIDNVFEDPISKDSYDLWGFKGHGKTYEESKLSKWYTGEPIWQTNMQISGRFSGSYHWPAGDATMNGVKRHKYKTWTEADENSNVWKANIDEMLNWFVKDVPKVNFILYYNSEPDTVQHHGDIYGSKVEETIRRVDDLIGYMIAECRRLGIHEKLNLIVTSDHGFVNVPTEVSFDSFHNYINYDLVERNSNSFFAIDGKESTEEEIYKNLTRAVSDGVKIKVWRKKDFPDKYHWKNNRRIGPVIWFRVTEQKHASPNVKHASGMYGTHLELLNDDRRLRVLFIARGPAFKKGFVLDREDVENVDYYPLMCNILGVKPAPNNGSLERIGSILNSIIPPKFQEFDPTQDHPIVDETNSKEVHKHVFQIIGKKFAIVEISLIVVSLFICAGICCWAVHFCFRCDGRRKWKKFYRNPQICLYDRCFKRKFRAKDLPIDLDDEPFLKNLNSDYDED